MSWVERAGAVLGALVGALALPVVLAPLGGVGLFGGAVAGWLAVHRDRPARSGPEPRRYRPSHERTRPGSAVWTARHRPA